MVSEPGLRWLCLRTFNKCCIQFAPCKHCFLSLDIATDRCDDCCPILCVRPMTELHQAKWIPQAMIPITLWEGIKMSLLHIKARWMLVCLPLLMPRMSETTPSLRHPSARAPQPPSGKFPLLPHQCLLCPFHRDTQRHQEYQTWPVSQEQLTCGQCSIRHVLGRCWLLRHLSI